MCDFLAGSDLVCILGNHPWAQKHMAGFCVHCVACKIHPTRGEFSCMQKSDSFLQHTGGKRYNGHMLICKEVTKLKDILGLQLAYQSVLINEGSLRKAVKPHAESLCWMLMGRRLNLVTVILTFCISREVQGLGFGVFLVVISCIVPQSINYHRIIES